MKVIHNLGVTKEVVLDKFEFNREAHLRMSWLRDMYHDLVEA